MSKRTRVCHLIKTDRAEYFIYETDPFGFDIDRSVYCPIFYQIKRDMDLDLVFGFEGKSFKEILNLYINVIKIYIVEKTKEIFIKEESL